MRRWATLWACLAMCSVGALVCVVVWPDHAVATIHQVQRAVQEQLHALLGPSPSAPQREPTLHLWDEAWNGVPLTLADRAPDPYDYQLDELQEFLIARAAQLDAARRARFAVQDKTGVTLLALGDQIRAALDHTFALPVDPQPLRKVTETPVAEDPDFHLTRVRLRNSHGLHVEGLLARPSTCGTRCPTLVVPNGASSSPEYVLGLGKEDYHHQVGRVFARAGYAVFAVYLPAAPGDFAKTNLAERHAWLWANLTATRNLSYWALDKVRSALDYLETLPWVDRERLALYGISGGGEAALYTTVLDPRVRALVVAGTNVLTPRWEMVVRQRRLIYPQMYGWGTLALPDVDDALVAIFPRPVCIELGVQDTTGNFVGAFQTAQHVAAVYQHEGHAAHFRVVVHTHHTTPDGHETEITQCQAFLEQLFTPAAGVGNRPAPSPNQPPGTAPAAVPASAAP